MDFGWKKVTPGVPGGLLMVLRFVDNPTAMIDGENYK